MARSRAIARLMEGPPVGSSVAPGVAGTGGVLDPMRASETGPQVAATEHATGGLSSVAPGLYAPPEEEALAGLLPETVSRMRVGTPTYGSVEAAGLPTAVEQLMSAEQFAGAGPFAHATMPGEVPSAAAALPTVQTLLSSPQARSVIAMLLARARGEPELGGDYAMGAPGVSIGFAEPPSGGPIVA